MRHESETPNDKRINLKVSPPLHTRLRIHAAREGTTLQDLLTTWVEEKLAESEQAVSVPPVERPALSPEERVARVDAAVGAMKHVAVSVDAFLREKHEATNE